MMSCYVRDRNYTVEEYEELLNDSDLAKAEGLSDNYGTYLRQYDPEFFKDCYEEWLFEQIHWDNYGGKKFRIIGG